MKKATYIQFENPKTGQDSKVDGITKRALKKAIIGVLSTIIPKANPDFDDKIDFVKNWLVELDIDTGIPEREIGLDKNGQVILKMPFENNYGYWTDNNLLLEDFKKLFFTSEISNVDFEKYWNSFNLTTDKTELKKNKNVG
ncbi:MAG TPA: hypothetical protein VKN14_11315 [Flavobacteriaceae bacterium]|nr:hypothetical protein [Flavobacteriaceae bacterium]